MRGNWHPRNTLSRVGASCPLCGARISTGSYFCARCGSSRRIRLDPGEVRKEKRQTYIPRELTR